MKFPPNIILNPDQTSFAFCKAREITLWDIKKREPVNSFTPEMRPLSAAIIPGSQLIALAGVNTLELWHMGTGKKVETLLSLTWDWFRRIVATPDGNYLSFTSCKKLAISVYDLQERSVVRTLRGHYNQIYGLAISHEGTTLISVEAGMGGMIAWDLPTGTKVWNQQQDRGFEFILSVTPDDKFLISSPYQFMKKGRIRVSNLKTGEKLKEWEGHEADVTDFAVATDNSFFVSCSEDKSLKVWNMETSELISSFTADAPLHCCGIVDNNTMIVAGDNEKLYFLKLSPSLQIEQ